MNGVREDHAPAAAESPNRRLVVRTPSTGVRKTLLEILIPCKHIRVIRYSEKVFLIMAILIGLGLTRVPRPVFCFATYLGLTLIGTIVYFSRMAERLNSIEPPRP